MITKRRYASATLVCVALVAAACGGDDDASPATNPQPTAALATTGAPPATDGGPGTTAAAPATTAAAPATTTGEPAGLDAFAELCPKEEAPDTMVLGVWGGPHEAVLEEGLAGFEELTGVDVELTLDGLQDRLVRLNAEKGNPSLDVALLPIDAVSTFLASGVTMPTQEGIPNTENLRDSAKVNGGYGISMFQLVIAYNPAHVTTPPTAWTDLLREEYAGHVALSPIPNANGVATSAMLGQSNGASDNDVEEGIELIAGAKDGVALFYSFEPAVEPQLESEDVWIMAGLSGLLQAAKDKGLPIEIALPEDGGPVLMNTAVIPEGVQHLGCSKALVGWLLSEDVQVPYAEQLYYLPANSAIELPAELTDKIRPGADDAVVDLDWAAIGAKKSELLDLWNRQVGS